MLTFDDIYSQFLTSVPDLGSAYHQLEETELKKELYNLLVPAIANFQFPHVPLDFEVIKSEPTEQFPSMAISGTFTYDVTQREINVLLALMRVQWMQTISNRESQYEQYYYDANMRTYSQSAMIAQISKRMEALKKEAKEAIFNYSRMNADGTVNTDRYKW